MIIIIWFLSLLIFSWCYSTLLTCLYNKKLVNPINKYIYIIIIVTLYLFSYAWLDAYFYDILICSLIAFALALLIVKKNNSTEKNDLSLIIYNLGYERYQFLDEQFSQQIKYNKQILFVMSEIITGLLFKRICYFQKINITIDIMNKINIFIDDVFNDDSLKQSIINVENELWNILKQENNDEMLYEISERFIDEITEYTDYDEKIVRYMIDVITNWHFESKKLLSKCTFA